MDVEKDRRQASAPRQGARLANENWPARTQRLLQICCESSLAGLREPLMRCLREFEQQLFAMAERARLPSEQQDFIVSRQLIQQRRGEFESNFMRFVVDAFHDLGAAPPVKETSATPANRSWQTLELLDTARQELSMTLEQTGARGETRHSAALHELGYRLAVLVAAPPLEGRSLPMGPQALATACLQCGSALQLPHEHQLLLLRQFDQWVIQTLGPLYASINTVLCDEGILPQLRSIPLPRHLGRKPARQAGDDTEAADNDVVAEAPRPAPARDDQPIQVLESLRNLLAQQRAGQSGSSHHPLGRAASEEELQTAMAALQAHLAQVTDRASRELRSAARLREELLTQLNLGRPEGVPRTELSGEQGDKVELIARLFEQIGQQLQHGSNARHLLGDLQLPVLRMAVADPGFFEQREHPARRLLDTVTAVAHDWLDGNDDESNRALASRLEQLVGRANHEPPSAGLYTSLLADIEHHLALLTRKAQAAERRHVEAAQGRERLDQARRRASELMADRFAQSPPRGLLRTLLDRAWSDVLALALLRHGEDSEEVAAKLAITDKLLGRLPIDDARTLQQEVEAGLQQIGMHAEESVQVAQRLLGVDQPAPADNLPSATDLAVRLKQHQRLGEQPSATPKPVPADPVAIEVPGTRRQPPEPSPRQRRIDEQLRKLPFGSWFEFTDPASGKISQRKLAWYSPMSGRCLLVSRRGQRSDEMSLSELAREIAEGRVRQTVEQRESLLDRAWRSLAGSLREDADRHLPTTNRGHR